MHISLSTWTTLSTVASTVTAFYPYEWKYGDGSKTNGRRTPRPLVPSQPAIRNDAPARSLTLPLRRVPIRQRENTYNIVNNADPKQENSVAIDQDGTDLSYMVAVTFGSSKEEYHLLLDSAASNTWVMGEECQTEACGRHNLFGKGDSDSLKTDTTPFSITYGTGSVSGTTASDTIHVGSLSSSLTFGLANNVSSEFNSYPMDGILGIGRGDTVEGTIEAPQLIEVLSSDKLISTKLYGVHLSRTKDGANDGELNFGEPNKDRFSGDLNWQDAVDNENGFWEVPIADAGADDEMISVKDRSALLDTGTSFILMPEDDAFAMHGLIDGFTQSGEAFTVPCDTKKAMQIKFGSTTYDISPADWVGGKADNGACRSNIIGRKTFGDKQWLVGDVFLKNVYTVFDMDSSQVGFGVKSDNEPTESSSASPTAQATATGGSATSTPVAASGSPQASAAADASSAESQSKEGSGPGQASVPGLWLAMCMAMGLVYVFV